MMTNHSPKRKVAVIGLGYVGLPLAVEFGHTALAPILGFDINQHRIQRLREGHDDTNEISAEKLGTASITYSSNEEDLSQADFFIVAVPTPINDAKEPDLMLVEKASELVARHITKGSIVVFESTVYPGVTEEICIPIMEKVSGLRCGIDWKIGYSPERVNPGDKEHTIERVVKIVSGMDKESLEIIAHVYEAVCGAGVHRASCIKVAEAAKVIENVQRDLNIALMNELALIFDRLGISTREVIEAAGTKWNFHKYTPGLVGGHCIGVDPYYLTHKAQQLGYNPEVILAGRRINDNMPSVVVELLVREMVKEQIDIQKSIVGVLGLSFKENVPDTRNSKADDVIRSLNAHGARVIAIDPVIDPEELHEFKGKFEFMSSLDRVMGKLDAVVIISPHKAFCDLTEDEWKKLFKNKPFLFDLKGKIKNIPDRSMYRSL